MPLDKISMAEDTFPDASENKASLISPVRTVNMGETVIVFPE